MKAEVCRTSHRSDEIDGKLDRLPGESRSGSSLIFVHLEWQVAPCLGVFNTFCRYFGKHLTGTNT